MISNQWRVRHPGIGILAYGSEAEAQVAAGTAGEVLPPKDLGGAAVIRAHGTGPRWGIVHVGPEPGACSVDVDGCGYCIGVPCRLPAGTANPEEDHDDQP